MSAARSSNMQGHPVMTSFDPVLRDTGLTVDHRGPGLRRDGPGRAPGRVLRDARPASDRRACRGEHNVAVLTEVGIQPSRSSSSRPAVPSSPRTHRPPGRRERRSTLSVPARCDRWARFGWSPARSDVALPIGSNCSQWITATERWFGPAPTGVRERSVRWRYRRERGLRTTVRAASSARGHRRR